jgi:hypothetical protein
VFPVVLAIGFALVLALVVRATRVKGRDDDLLLLMLGGYVVRLGLQAFVRDLPLFSHGGGGDCELYEAYGHFISRIWQAKGFMLVTQDELPEVGPTSLPPNLFAAVIYMNDGEKTRLGCTAVVALMACLTCLDLYRIAVDLGAEPRIAFRWIAVLMFSPAFLLYTSDTFKDGPVAFFVTLTLTSALRLARSFSVRRLVIGLVSLWALWHVRYYLVFVTTLPFLVGLIGLRAQNAIRPLLATIALTGLFLVVAGFTGVFDSVAEHAGGAFAQGTDRFVVASNAGQGSGVTFDDGGSPWGALLPKLVYTVLSPFPWQSGSFGLHVGKLDVAIWYYAIYRSAIAARRMWKSERTILLMFLSFLVPTLVMYATGFSNVGLNLRQRLPVVMVGVVLALLSRPARSAAGAEAKGEADEESMSHARQARPASPGA